MVETKLVQIVIRDKLMQDILKDTIADSKERPSKTLETIFEAGLSIIASHVSTRCPRLQRNLEKWLGEGSEV